MGNLPVDSPHGGLSYSTLPERLDGGGTVQQVVQQVDLNAYSIDLYARPRVEASCLRLQDGYGLDVNVVLFCFWFGACHGVIDEALWQRIDQISQQWQTRLVRPLREARRGLKALAFESDGDREALRSRIAENEIAAELLQQGLMQNACEESAADGTGLSTLATPAAQPRSRAGRKSSPAQRRGAAAALRHCIQ